MHGDQAVEVSAGAEVEAVERQRWADRAGAAVARVRQPAYSTVDHPVRLELLGDSAALERAIGARSGSLRQIAAVTTTPARSTAAECVRIFVNLEVADRMQAAGVDALLRHESVHLLVGDALAAGTRVPRWLSEGEADRIALLGVPGDEAVFTARLRSWLRQHPVPSSLPSDQSFAPGAPDLEVSYQQAWLAAKILAELGGPRSAQRLRDNVRSGRSLTQSLIAVGVPQARLLRVWRDTMRSWQPEASAAPAAS